MCEDTLSIESSHKVFLEVILGGGGDEHNLRTSIPPAPLATCLVIAQIFGQGYRQTDTYTELHTMV